VSKKSSWFSDFAKKTARAAGHPIVFALAEGIVVLWLITGPLFGFSDTWQLIINGNDDCYIPDGILDSEYPKP